jgi:hypothetical protein
MNCRAMKSRCASVMWGNCFAMVLAALIKVFSRKL